MTSSPAPIPVTSVVSGPSSLLGVEVASVVVTQHLSVVPIHPVVVVTQYPVVVVTLLSCTQHLSVVLDSVPVVVVTQHLCRSNSVSLCRCNFSIPLSLSHSVSRCRCNSTSLSTRNSLACSISLTLEFHLISLQCHHILLHLQFSQRNLCCLI